MTIAELKAFAARRLDDAIEDIRKTGELRQVFYLVKRGGGMDTYLLAADVTNDEDAKRQFGQQLKARVAAGDIEAVVHVSDSFLAEIEPEKNAVRKALGLTIKQAADAGLCTAREAVLCIVESPILYQVASQEYRRGGGRVELAGDPAIASDEDGRPLKIPGRFTFFP